MAIAMSDLLGSRGNLRMAGGMCPQVGRGFMGWNNILKLR